MFNGTEAFAETLEILDFLAKCNAHLHCAGPLQSFGEALMGQGRFRRSSKTSSDKEIVHSCSRAYVPSLSVTMRASAPRGSAESVRDSLTHTAALQKPELQKE